MLDEQIQILLRQANSNPALEEQLVRADSYAELEAIGESRGLAVREKHLRSAFRARNAQVLIQHMMRQGMAASENLAPVPAMHNEVWRKVMALQLEAVTQQLVRFAAWSEGRAGAAERRYRRFLFLKAVFPNHSASPSEEIDQYWHQHIINTAKYSADCKMVAGIFLHHDFLEPDDTADARKLETLRLETWIAYEVLFEEPYEETLGAAFLQRWPSRM